LTSGVSVGAAICGLYAKSWRAQAVRECLLWADIKRPVVVTF
jgi:hypothetical protein